MSETKIDLFALKYLEKLKIGFLLTWSSVHFKIVKMFPRYAEAETAPKWNPWQNNPVSARLRSEDSVFRSRPVLRRLRRREFFS